VNGDYTAPAALAAKALGKPVKLLLTRPDDLRFDSFRSPLCAPIRLAVASAGGCLQMSADKCCRQLNYWNKRSNGLGTPC
jgi:isoquinoline 1-oxidoreductase subunit beta